jgi:serine O-acetyltransferase
LGDRAGEDAFVAARLHSALSTLRHEVDAEIAYWQEENDQPFDADHASTIVRHFAMTLPNIRQLTDSDLSAALVGDPAARSIDESSSATPMRSRRSAKAPPSNAN